MRVRARVTLIAIAQGEEPAALLAEFGVLDVGIRARGAESAGGGLVGCAGPVRKRD